MISNCFIRFLSFVLILYIALSGFAKKVMAENRISSPDGRIEIFFQLKDSVPYYNVNRDGEPVILSSKMGFLLKDAPALDKNFSIEKTEQNSFNETWEQPWGEVRFINNHYNELCVQLKEKNKTPRYMTIIFRAYNDGIGFRYEFPQQKNLADFNIMDELTEFAMPADGNVWWIPAFRGNRYEYLFTKSPISDIDTVHTPLTMETRQGLYLSFHEANLTDYASMTLSGSDDFKLRCVLIPWSDGIKVKASTPFKTPWRTVQIAEKPGNLITSYLILNLNDPNKLGDVSWITSGKYVGIWWGMHIDKYTWGSGEKHGATTENAKRYIDFAAKYGFIGVLIEGWNIGWDGNWIQNGSLFNFTTPYPDFDIKEVTRYAASKGVKIIGHHETGADIANYERQMEDAFKYYKSMGIDMIKTGYVGTRVHSTMGTTEWHHGQYMVEHYRKVVELAAKYKIMLDVHEPIKDTGIRRTYPNMMTREGARGQEYNAWSQDGGNPLDYLTIIPFTRCLAGPFDYTPGIFDLTLKSADRPNNRVRGTLAKELAIYVVVYSPLVMAADLIENYQDQPAFKFIVDVPTDWSETRVLDGNIGDYITVVRKDSKSDDWYLGSITDENGRKLEAPLSFLDSGKIYVAEIYADAADTNWKDNPLAINMQKALVNQQTTLQLRLAPGGGQAVRIHPAIEEDLKQIPDYED
jgi:alpha-glucosidase